VAEPAAPAYAPKPSASLLEHAPAASAARTTMKNLPVDLGQDIVFFSRAFSAFGMRKSTPEPFTPWGADSLQQSCIFARNLEGVIFYNAKRTPTSTPPDIAYSCRNRRGYFHFSAVPAHASSAAHFSNVPTAPEKWMVATPLGAMLSPPA
jgi:hypothetical protein